MRFTVNRLSDTAGEVVGLDCSGPLDADTLAALKRTMLDFPVVAIRAQSLHLASRRRSRASSARSSRRTARPTATRTTRTS
jgi:hypothetical protein